MDWAPDNGPARGQWLRIGGLQFVACRLSEAPGGFSPSNDIGVGSAELSPHYAAASARAQDQGWRYRHLRGGLFEMLVRPADVAEAILEFAGEH